MPAVMNVVLSGSGMPLRLFFFLRSSSFYAHVYDGPPKKMPVAGKKDGMHIKWCFLLYSLLVHGIKHSMGLSFSEIHSPLWKFVQHCKNRHFSQGKTFSFAYVIWVRELKNPFSLLIVKRPSSMQKLPGGRPS